MPGARGDTMEANPTFETLAYLWRKRSWILLGTLCAAVLGAVYCLVAPRVYTAEAILFPKESRMNAGQNLLAGAGLNLNPFQNSNLTRLSLFLSSEELAENVIRNDTLLPVLFPKQWDAERKAWKQSSPSLLQGVRTLRPRVRAGADARNLYLQVYVSMPRPDQAVRVLKGYLRELNAKVRNDARKEAERNRLFLYEQLGQTADPLVQEKIQYLMASQVENLMYMSESVFDLPENPRLPVEPDKPKKLLVMIGSVVFGLFGSILFLLGRRQWVALKARLWPS